MTTKIRVFTKEQVCKDRRHRSTKLCPQAVPNSHASPDLCRYTCLSLPLSFSFRCAVVIHPRVRLEQGCSRVFQNIQTSRDEWDEQLQCAGFTCTLCLSCSSGQVCIHLIASEREYACMRFRVRFPFVSDFLLLSP